MKTLCADMGGSRIKLAAVEDGKILENDIVPLDTNGGMEGVLALLAERARLMMAKYADGEWSGLGAAFPGHLDEENCRVFHCAGKYAGADRIDLRKWSRETLGLDIRLVNDARAAIIGEVNYGSARGETDAVMIILGTGVGTAAVCNGKVYRGRHGTAGILGGHFSIDFDGGRKCAMCGGDGCMEAYVGTWALKEMAGDPDYDFRKLEAEWRKGDPKAKDLFRTVSTAIGAGTVTLLHAFDPESIIFSGGTSRFTELIDAASEYVLKHAWTPWGRPRFITAENPEASVVLGLYSLFDGRVR